MYADRSSYKNNIGYFSEIITGDQSHHLLFSGFGFTAFGFFFLSFL